MSNTDAWRALSIMAHQDDFEFNAGGFFALLKRSHGQRVHLNILTTTRGASGHPDRSLMNLIVKDDLS